MGAYTTIDNADEHFQTTIYTGNAASSRDITNTGDFDLKPDILWIKNRDDTDSYVQSFSTFRTDGGAISASLYFESDVNATRQYDTTTAKTFNTDGFTIGNSAQVNTNNEKYVAWQWQLQGGSLTTNSTGDLNSEVQLNSTAKMSSGTYTGNGSSGATVGHSLGLKPDFIYIRCFSRSEDGQVYMKGAETANGGLQRLNETTNVNNNPVLFTSQPTTSLFAVGTNFEVNQNNGKYVFWAMANVQGFSNSGEYVGNGNANGRFVATGFKPSWLMIKRFEDSSGDGWHIFDNKRDPINPAKRKLFANSNTYENAGATIAVDLLSNGFKVRATDSGLNVNNGKYAFLAFAEHPAVTSTGIPATAR